MTVVGDAVMELIFLMVSAGRLRAEIFIIFDVRV